MVVVVVEVVVVGHTGCEMPMEFYEHCKNWFAELTLVMQ